MHYLMNKDIVTLEIETMSIINKSMMPLALNVNTLTHKTIHNWLMHRALPLNRKNADKVYMTLNLPRDNNEIELMYLTHSLSINDNFWIADECEVGKIKYKDINLFTNSLNKSMYLAALRGDTVKLVTTDNILSAEYTGQGSYPKCFVKEENELYLYKSSPDNEITNEIYAGFIAQLLGFNSVTYEYKTLENINCTKSKIVTGLNENWETAFILSEHIKDNYGSIPQEMAMQLYGIEYSNMIIFDAIILNDDRHMKNWSFSIDANTNRMLGIATSYDYNKAFEATSKSMSNLLFDGYRRLNLLSAARKAYREVGTTLDISYLYNVINDLNLKLNKVALRNRLLYITGQKDNQSDCY